MTQEHQTFHNRIGQLLDSSLDKQDEATLLRLRAARSRAIARVDCCRSKPRLQQFFAAVVLAGLSTLAIFVTLSELGSQMPSPTNPASVSAFGAMDLLADPDAIELIQEIEFYDWLENEAAAELTAGDGRDMS